ncbi:serine hydrolase domain-containing protein [Paenibacillus sp. GP183]|jgi:CubicO group peptidase (beta-lactamase class C family)|uniref:serine hydrolase domain-containing protein n=1 Tax=Paenibacillus sp. GP183 TaxID=1882751 RepID=UPI0008986BBF|nr:serine hydrolase domain-containing protein [Paenibacillus sp. GP183]SEC43770.1 CubicO group peptidase, beta-lactamase class C family [Paenibacillus sp. GP183]
MDNVDRLVQDWLQEGLLPGAVLDITLSNRVRFQKSYGSFSDGTKECPIRLNTLFDIASLTKVTATLPAILILVSQGKVSLESSVQKYVPAFHHPQVSVRHLLQHASGLPPDLPVRPRKEKRPALLEEILAQELNFQPGEDMQYSDLGMILLGIIVERVTGEPLDRFVKQYVFDPLGMRDTVYTPSLKLQERVAATEPLDGTFIIGEVHDEKCFHLGGVSGSAGLFATADDLTRYAAWWLAPESQDLIPSWLMREATGHSVRGRGLGWEVSHDPTFVPSCGVSWPPGSFGHTGFTGTSLWIEPKQGISVVFLTNAVHLGRNNKIRELRPILHEAVWSSCKSGG